MEAKPADSVSSGLDMFEAIHIMANVRRTMFARRGWLKKDWCLAADEYGFPWRRGTRGNAAPWTPSHDDAFATDWVEVTLEGGRPVPLQVQPGADEIILWEGTALHALHAAVFDGAVIRIDGWSDGITAHAVRDTPYGPMMLLSIPVAGGLLRPFPWDAKSLLGSGTILRYAEQ